MSSTSGPTGASPSVSWSDLSAQDQEQRNREAAKFDNQGYVKPLAYEVVSIADQSNLSLFVKIIVFGVLAGLILGLPAAAMGYDCSGREVSVEEISQYSIPIGIAISTIGAAVCCIRQRKKAREVLQSEDLTAGESVHTSELFRFSLSARMKKLMARLF